MADRTFLDWPFFEDRHRALASDLEAWCKAHLSAAPEGDVDDTCRGLVRLLGQGDWLRYAVPRAYGGAFEDIDVRSVCLIRETLARHSALADFTFAMQGLGSGAITLAGSDVLKKRYLPKVADGSLIAAFALTEERSGSDAANIEMTAKKAGGAYELSGAKTFISNGGIADFYTVFARTGGEAGARGITAFVADAATPGLSIAERIETIAPHPLARLSFDKARVMEEMRLGEEGQGFKLAMATLDIFRSSVGAAALGLARRALDEALARTRIRRLFGMHLADMPVVQADIADLATGIDASALLVYRAAWTRDVANRRNTREAAMAKMYATECAQHVIDRAVQLHGGLGVTKGVPVEALYREIRALRIYEGATEVQRTVIARQILREGGET